MGLLDKVKETAQKGADLAKEGVKAGQDKIDEQKLKKKIGDLKEELGGVVYAQKSGTTAEGVDPEVEIARIVAEINATEAELAAGEAADSRRPGRDAGARASPARARRRRGRAPSASSPSTAHRQRVGRDPVADEVAPVDDVGGDGHVGRCPRATPAPIGTSQSPPPGPVSTNRAVLPSCSRPAIAERQRQDPTGEIGHQRQVTGLGRQRRESRRRGAGRRCAPTPRTTRTSRVSSRVSPRPRQIAVRSGLATAHARLASTEARHSATASSRSRPAKRGSNAWVRATMSSSSSSSMVGVAEVLCEQALLRRHVHDQVVGGQPVRRDDVERIVGQLDDRLLEAVRQRHVDVDHRVGGVHLGAASAASRTRSRIRPGGSIASAAPSHAATLASRSASRARSGRRVEHRLDGRDLLGIARVERVGAEQLLDLGLRQLERGHHSPPSASSVAAMRRSASRSRDFAVPSGMPSVSATCR